MINRLTAVTDNFQLRLGFTETNDIYNLNEVGPLNLSFLVKTTTLVEKIFRH